MSQPHNIAQVADRAFWIDIQPGLRDDGALFSMQRAHELLCICQEWIDSHASGESLTGVELGR